MKIYLTVEDAYAVVVGGYERAQVWLKKPARESMQAQSWWSEQDRANPGSLWLCEGHHAQNARQLCKTLKDEPLRDLIWDCLRSNFTNQLEDRSAIMDRFDQKSWPSLMTTPATDWIAEMEIESPATVYVTRVSPECDAKRCWFSKPEVLEYDEGDVFGQEGWRWADYKPCFSAPLEHALHALADHPGHAGLLAAAETVITGASILTVSLSESPIEIVADETTPELA